MFVHITSWWLDFAAVLTIDFSSPVIQEPSSVLDSHPFVTQLCIKTSPRPYRSTLPCKYEVSLHRRNNILIKKISQQHSAHGRLRSLAHITRRALKRGVAPCADVVRCLSFNIYTFHFFNIHQLHHLDMLRWIQRWRNKCGHFRRWSCRRRHELCKSYSFYLIS